MTKADGRFVAADPDLDRVLDAIGENGLAVRQVWVRWMPATPVRIALWSLAHCLSKI